MRNDVYEILIKAMDRDIDPSFPPIFPLPKEKIQIRLISKPLTYFVSPDFRAIRPAVPKFVEWHTTYDVNGLQPPDGFLKLDDYQIHKYDDEPSRRGVCWGDMLPPPKNGVLQRFRIACFDRADKDLKWLDFGVELFVQFCEYSDNFNAPPGGPNGPDWIIKVDRPHEGPYARIRALFLDKVQLSMTELALIKNFNLKDRLIESVKQSSCTCCHGCHCELHDSLPDLRPSLSSASKPKRTLDEIIDDAKAKLTKAIAQCQSSSPKKSEAAEQAAIAKEFVPDEQDPPKLRTLVNPYIEPVSAFEMPFQREYQRTIIPAFQRGTMRVEPGAGKTKIDWLEVPSLNCPIQHQSKEATAVQSRDGSMWRCLFCDSAGPVKDGVAMASDDPKIPTDAHMWNASIHATPKADKDDEKPVPLKCPYHDDYNPSAMLSQDKTWFQCFSCGGQGPVRDGVPTKSNGNWARYSVEPKSVITAVQTPREPKSFSKEELQKSLDVVEASNSVLSFKMEGDLDKWQYASLVCSHQEPFRRCADAPEVMHGCGCHANWAIETFDRATSEEAEEREPYVVYACKKHLSEMLNPEIRYSIIPIPQRKPDAPTQSQTDQGF